jgi:hypothetical protein
VKAAVVGGGIFGCTAAVALARAGVEVDLYERNSDILLGASRGNCGRLHRGYHYPRSESTARATMAAADEFGREYPSAVWANTRHHYVIAGDSPVTAHDYVDFLDRMGLPYRVTYPPLVHGAQVTVWAPESLIHPARLRTAVRRQLRAHKVNVRMQQHGGPEMPGYDLTVLAAYGQHTSRLLQFEVCEIAVIKLGLQYTGHSYVVLDGPYCCLDPLPGTEFHLLYDVVNSVHHSNVGYWPEIPDHLVPLLDRGPVFGGPSRVQAMEQTARRHLSGIGMPTYHGSMYTVRAVLPDVEATDERPTLVERDGNTISILSGKLDTAVAAARQVVGVLVPA